MPHLMVDHRDPFSLAEIDPAALPVFGMNQVNPSVLKGLAGGFAPVEIFVPFDPRKLEIVEAAEFRDCFPERKRAAEAKEIRQIPVDHPALTQRRENHSQGRSLHDVRCINHRNLPRRRSNKQAKLVKRPDLQGENMYRAQL